MPEGPEVETVRRTLAPHLVGAVLGAARVSPKALRTKVTARAFAAVAGRTVRAVDRHGKALFIELDDDSGLQVRLGMTGRLVLVDADVPRAAHTHVTIQTTTAAGPRELRYVDARRFGEVVPYAAGARVALVDGMGPD